MDDHLQPVGTLALSGQKTYRTKENMGALQTSEQHLPWECKKGKNTGLPDNSMEGQQKCYNLGTKKQNKENTHRRPEKRVAISMIIKK